MDRTCDLCKPAATRERFFKRLKARQTLLGTWLYMGDLGVADLLSRSGFDYLVIDTEHSPTGFDGLRAIIMAVENHCPILVRVKANKREYISNALDLGAAGVVVPMTNTVKDMQEAVQFAKYAPLGSRGVGPIRAADYGRSSSFLTDANRQQLLIPQIENVSAIGALDEIMAVDGVDGFFIGPADLSQSLGHLGDVSHPEVVGTINHIAQKLSAAGMAVGAAFASPTELSVYADSGLNFFTIGADFRFLRNGAEAFLKDGRKALQSPRLMPELNAR